MMEYQKEDLDYQVTLNSFSQEIVHKIMLIQKHTFDFERLTNQKSNSGKCAIQMVKFCRKVIQDIERIVIGVKGYLHQLNIGNFYSLLYSMFRILVLSFNNLSQKFIIYLKNRKITEQNEQQVTQLQDQQVKTNKNSKKQIKQIQYLDFIIKGLQVQEQKIQQQRKMMQKQLRQQSKSLAKITSSDTVNQLQNLNKELQKIINNSYKISGENVLYRYQELSKKILTFKKPQQIQDQFCNVFGSNMRKKFLQGMEKIIKQLYLTIRNKQKQKITIQILGQKPILETIGIQTETDSKARQIDQLIRQKKQINNEIDSLKKSNNILQKQVQKITDKFRQSKQHSKNYQKKIAQLQSQVKRKTTQFFNSKLEYERTIDNMNKKRFKQSSESLFTQFQQQSKLTKKFSVQQRILTQNDQQNVKKTFKNRIKQKNHYNLHHKKQNFGENIESSQFLKGIQGISQKLAEIDLINQQQFDQLIKNLQTGHFQQRLQGILFQFSRNLVNIKENELKLMSTSKISNKSKNNLKACVIQKETQTQILNQNTIQLSLNKKDQIKDDQTSKNKTEKKISKLQMFKQQFLQKVSLKKAQSSLIKSNASKYYKKYQDHQRKQLTRYQYESSDNGYHIQENDQIKTEKIGKAKLFFNMKDISFEEFKLAKVPNKSNMLEKKYPGNKIKRKENLLTESHNTNQQFHPKKPIFSLQNYQVLKQVKIVSEMLNLKNDKNNNFLKGFLQNILQQVKKTKGRALIEQVFRKQLCQSADKQDKPQTRVNRPKYINLQINNTFK